MVIFTFLWEKIKWIVNRIGMKFKSLGGFLDEHHGPTSAFVLIVTLLWVILWSFYQDRKADALYGLVIEQGKNIRLLIRSERRNTTKQIENNTNIVSEKISALETNQKANTKELTEEYAKIVSEKISDLNAKMTGETVRMIIASHENIQRARDDTYKKAIDEACKAGYIYETNQEPDEDGICIFKTGYNWKSGQEDEKGSTLLLTTKEKGNINECLENYFKKEKTEKLKDGFANTDTQKKIFSFLLRKSNIGCLIISPVYEIQYWTPYREEKTRLLTPFAKLGAVIGHIGDKITN